MPLFFTAPELIFTQEAFIRGEEAHHLARVLRVQKGEMAKVTDGGRLFKGKFLSVHPDEVIVGNLEPVLAPPPPYPITLHISLIKPDKLEWMIEKAVELNIAEVGLILSARSSLRDLSDSKMDRLRKISAAAQKQCERLTPLTISPLSDFTKAMDAAKGTQFFCCEREDSTDGFTRSDRMTLWVGPEGGWSEEEIAQARKKDCTFASLGPLILRAETAAVTAMSLAASSYWK